MRLDRDQHVVGPKVGELPGQGRGGRPDRRFGRSVHTDSFTHDLAEPLAAGHDRHRMARGQTGGEDAADRARAEDEETDGLFTRHRTGNMTE